MNTSVLKAVWGTQSGYVFVPRRKKGDVIKLIKDTWDEGKAYKYPEDWDDIKSHVVTSAKDGWDTYWCPLVFDKPKRLKECVKPQQALLWADLDFVDPTKLGTLRPSIAWASSDTRYQGLWALDGAQDIAKVEQVNKDLTYHIGADHGGWDVTQVLRIPGSPNYKYDPPQQGKMLWAEKRIFVLDKVASAVKDTEPQEETSTQTLSDLLDGWTIPARARDLILASESEVEVGERSDRLWEIETSLVEAGLPILTIVDIISKCPFNKFRGRKDEMNQIYKEVTKADVHVKQRAKKTTSKLEVDPEAEKLKEQTWAIPFDKFVGKKLETPEWLVEGIWQKGTYGMIAGEPKTYKSVQATDLALSVASGRPFLNYFPVLSQGSVLYIQEENGESLVQDRINKIAASKGLLTSSGNLPPSLPLYVSNNYGINLTEDKSRILLEQTIQKINPVLVILDPLYMMLGNVDENSAKEVGDVLRWLTYLRNQYRCAILICHHYNKGNATVRGGQRVRGSSAFHAWVESALYVKTTSETYTVEVEREFRGFQKVPDFKVKIELGSPGELYYNPTTEITGSSSTAPTPTQSASTELQEEGILNALVSKPQGTKDLEALGFSNKSLVKALSNLVNAEKIVKSKGVKGSPAVYSISRGSSNDDKMDL